jgi:hypothetical protein
MKDHDPIERGMEKFDADYFSMQGAVWAANAATETRDLGKLSKSGGNYLSLLVRERGLVGTFEEGPARDKFMDSAKVVLKVLGALE